MKRFEGFVFDIDNTAVPEGSLKVTSESLLKAFHALDKSTPAIAATGRTLEFALPITSELALYHESIVANGAQIIESKTGTVLQQSNLNIEQVERIIALCKKYDATAHCCIAGDPVGSFYTANQQQSRKAPGVFFMNLSKHTAESFLEELKATEVVSAYISNYESLYDVNIGSTEAEKGKSLLKLLAIKAINPLRMIAVGDSVNDISLFEAVGYRVAMADAHPALLAMADEVVAPQRDNGLLTIVEHFI